MILLIGSGMRRTSVGTARDLVAGGQLRRHHQIDDLNAVLSGEVRLTDPLTVRQGHDRLRGLAGDVEPEFEAKPGGLACRFFSWGLGLHGLYVFRPLPLDTGSRRCARTTFTSAVSHSAAACARVSRDAARQWRAHVPPAPYAPYP
jgi:hypothetical protein